ncbi:Phage baseplate assembly protein W [Balnearium lithotrophicum]|uniref:Phage baseplate assembly protein W n=1 Tax=Balnearium lithotrophicum TaxID=223788 RepID=A0A521CK88_9BACT|nr:GPW/gp25 family protein [Balnearium lithotrophicum]SMO59090.1 Phage baseplate assembly protein W [Balnearium lithotrophicum]
MAVYKGFGLGFNKGTISTPPIKEDEALIADSIKQIVLTAKGERAMLRNFGSDWRKVIFEPNDDVLVELMRVVVEEAIKKWEKRVVFRDLELIERKENYVKFKIYYEIIGLTGTKQVDINFPIY